MQKVIIGLILSAFLTAGAVTAVCADQTGQRDKIEERLEIVTAWKMTELNIDRPTIEKILEVRRKFISQKKAFRKELDQDFQKLRLLLKDEKAKTDEKEIGQVLDDIRQKRRQLQGLMDEQFREVAKFLSVRQQAELVLFLKDFHKEIRSLLRPLPGPSGGPSSDRGRGPRGGSPSGGAMGPPGPPPTPQERGTGLSMPSMAPGTRDVPNGHNDLEDAAEDR
jgi:hypothetical protein